MTDQTDDLGELRVELLNLQYQLMQADFAVMLLIAGDDRPGAVHLLRTLHEWMDARYLINFISFGTDQSENAERPILRRYWRRLPPEGKIGVFLGGWPTSFLRTAVEERWQPETFEQALADINYFEQQQLDHGTLLLKYWLHLPEDILRQRIQAAKQNPETHWDIAQHDWEIYEQEGDVYAQIQNLLHGTDTERAPWHVLDSANLEQATKQVGQQIANSLRARLATTEPANTVFEPFTNAQPVISDNTVKVDKQDYQAQLEALQSRLNDLARTAAEMNIANVLVFEGVDAAGKGGTIRRLVRALPVQLVRVIPISAPDESERARHYLWRFWTRIPTPGKWTVFDRSWYGRVLIERVEALISEAVWQRAYQEINHFEQGLVEAHMVVTKFWLQIDYDEQERRFNARAKTPHKKYKLTPDDLRNRELWHEYQEARKDMLAQTDSEHAPWHVIDANDKRSARLAVLRIVCQRLSDAIEAQAAQQ